MTRPWIHGKLFRESLHAPGVQTRCRPVKLWRAHLAYRESFLRKMQTEREFEIMGQQEYLIGDIAAITGLSRDTLRFYEKKGILTARKKANGYRYFTEEDLYLLVRILFSRKLNFGLDITRELLPSDPLSPDYQETLQRQVREEMEAIRSHKQTLQRLLSMRKIYGGVGTCKGRFCMKTFPAALLMCTADSMEGGLRQWFLLSQKYPGLDMVYIYDCYQYRSGFTLEPRESGGTSPEALSQADYEAELSYQRSCLVLYKDVMEDMELDYDFSGCKVLTEESCIHTVVEAKDVRPHVPLISAMRRWAAERGLVASPDVLVTSNFSRIQEDSNSYVQEIYIPLLSG